MHGREGSLLYWSAWVEIRGDIVQTIDSYGERVVKETFDIRRSCMSKRRKADNESDERKCQGSGYQTASTAKEKDLRSIPDRI